MKLSLLPRELELFYMELSEIQKHSNDSWIYSTSQFFSKVDAYPAILKFTKGSRVNTILIFSQLSKYIIYSSLNFALLILIKILFVLVRKPQICKISKNIIYTDTYLTIKHALKSENLIDNYFPRLGKILKAKGFDCIIIPRLCSPINPFDYFRLIRKLNKIEAKVITDFDLLNSIDLISISVYLILYPYKMLQFYIRHIKNKPNSDFLRLYFWLDFNGSNFYSGVRYFSIKKFVRSIEDNVKVVQWFENQPYDKVFNGLVRASNLNVKIYGSQAFLSPIESLNLYLDPNEIEIYKPHCILVNGEYYLDKQNKIYKIGPSFRYLQLFQTKIAERINANIVILLSYFLNSNFSILNFVNSLALKSHVRMKLHPTDDIDSYRNHIKFDFELYNENLYSLLSSSGLIIGSSSGSLVEAIACGVPVILVTDNGHSDYSYLPYFCKGILWEEAHDKESFEIAKVKLFSVFEDQSEIRMEMIHRVRNEMFCEPTEERILKAFELNV
jgi:hypothetical protein